MRSLHVLAREARVALGLDPALATEDLWFHPEFASLAELEALEAALLAEPGKAAGEISEVVRIATAIEMRHQESERMSAGLPAGPRWTSPLTRELVETTVEARRAGGLVLPVGEAHVVLAFDPHADPEPERSVHGPLVTNGHKRPVLWYVAEEPVEEPAEPDPVGAEIARRGEAERAAERARQVRRAKALRETRFEPSEAAQIVERIF